MLSILYSHIDLVYSQSLKTYQIKSGFGSPLPPSNAINDIVVNNDTIWFGTERGLCFTTDDGNSWFNLANSYGFDNKGVSAIAIKGNNIWVALGYITYLDNEPVQTGGGIHYSTDHGNTWHYIPQPVDHNVIDTIVYGNNKVIALPTTVPQFNITFDIAISSNYVWIASWAGMLRRKHIHPDSTTWERIILPTDNLNYISPFDSITFELSPVANNNHKVFSIYISNDSTIWVGTAGGINKSTDGGTSWRKFSHENQSQAISGNFVVALNEQTWRNNKIMWAATVNADNPNEIKGLSFSFDGGESWKTTLLGEWVHNIAFKDSIVYAATDNGLFRTSDFGNSWTSSGDIYDTESLQKFALRECYCVGIKGDTVWYGGPEGIAYTIDSPLKPFGTQWKIFRTYESVLNRNKTYAYPNPFAPDDESTRIHYAIENGSSATQSVTIRIFDFAMHPVRTIIQNAPRQTGKEYDEIWDGKNNNNTVVANGVYFYCVETGNSKQWGKILVLR